MAYHTYTTPCLILKSTNIGESNRLFSLFSRDLGLVHAHAKSVREERSKLRHHLGVYSFSEVSLVRGRELWRITGAQGKTDSRGGLQGAREKQRLVVRTCSLLARLLQGEEADIALFDLVERGVQFLKEAELDSKLMQDFEYMFVIRILAHLGYVGEQKELSALLAPSPFSREALLSVGEHRNRALRAINQALEASGL